MVVYIVNDIMELYETYRVNGQEILHFLPDCFGQIGENCEILIRNIPPNFTTRDVFDLFFEYGTIYSVRLMMRFSGSNRGFCFLQFTTPSDAQKAILHRNGARIPPGHRLSVMLSAENHILFVSDIPKYLAIDTVKNSFSQIPGLTKMVMYQNRRQRKYNRGFAFLEFADQHSASVARKDIVRIMDTMWGVEYPFIDWAQPEKKVPDEIMSEVRVVFLRGLYPTLTSVENVIDVLSTFISLSGISNVEHFGNFAFITAVNRTGAAMMVNNLNGMTVYGHSLEADFARPKNF